MSRPSWLPDPGGAHAYRLWDGEAWTARVADAGVETQDPIDGRHFAEPSRWRGLLPSVAGVVAAGAVIGVVALVAMLSRHTPRDTGTFQLHFSDQGQYTVHSVKLQAGETLHAKVRVAGGTVRLGLGIPAEVLDKGAGFPLTVLQAQRHNGARALLGQTGNVDLDKALGHQAPEGTVAFPGFTGWVASDHAVIDAQPAGALQPGNLLPFTAKVAGTYDVILIGEQPGARAVLNVHITRGDPSLDLGSWGSVVQPDRPSPVRALKDLLATGRPTGAVGVPQSGAG